ncbi:NAD(P)-binding protein [Cryphonectria parasitica EP155]|uniref:NAD(P)-binding protein n=1 Tax=Cryphonectria parasitica (strain ATCC 38755 / EP155) TaxID=660469 RepID=A0A9P5CKS5_CRYP1|nr:NAD(P)-binding protein [Cryphonectria parasitica EP155]KAF3762363.1 NAD(P)-binding protein [Cryphonectria parasitica EP155]
MAATTTTTFPPEPPIALITAGSAGLGAEVATLFARNGMRVVINYHSDDQRAQSLLTTLQAVSTLTPQPGRTDFYAIRADLAVQADVERLVTETISVMCPLDVVFSNGGWTRLRDITNLDDNMVEDDWDRCFTMNVKSHLWLMHAAKPHLEAAYQPAASGGGPASFITTASLAGVHVSGSSLAYSVTKAAQLHLVRGLAKIGAPKIKVNSVSPGLMMTDVAEQVLALVKMKSVSGQNVVMDGGYLSF